MANATLDVLFNGTPYSARPQDTTVRVRFEPGDSVLAPVYYPGSPVRVVGPDGATVEITLDASALRLLARRALQNSTGRATAGPCRAKVTHGGSVPTVR